MLESKFVMFVLSYSNVMLACSIDSDAH